jgi:methionyl-tRNA formyltransferase
VRLLAAAVRPEWRGAEAPGALLGRGPAGGPLVATGSGALELLELQPAGRRPLRGPDWLNGLREQQGRFGL